MKLTIIGAGNMGRAIATRAATAGHEVQVIDRDPAEAESLAQELGGSAQAGEQGGELTGDVVVFALYYPGILDAVGEHRDALAGKVVVDISNPVDFETFDRRATETSAAEEIAERLPEGARVVKAFNTTFANTVREGQVDGQTLDVFLAGDDDGAKRQVASLVESIGLRAIDTGPLRRARQLEELGLLHMTLQEPLGTGFGSTLKLHP